MSQKIKDKLINELKQLLDKNISNDKKPIADKINIIIQNDQAIRRYLDQEFDEFKQKASKGIPKSIGLSGSWWRAINRRYDSEPLSIYGSQNGSARFNEQGEKTIYLAENSTTANLEVQLDKNFVTYSLWAIDFKLSGILDLTDTRIISALGINTGLMYGAWDILNKYKITSYSQKVSSYLRVLGYEGFIYESTNNQERKCTVVFMDNLKIGSFLEVHDKTQKIKPQLLRIDGEL
ncbi:MAG TPA: hypothetical protein ENG95_04725 [Nitrospirae bacterium]|nr:RES domain protein [bacterium BMS3Bbin09]HDO25925.1 hypothetical protein [Nitrospirota bacterium]HDO67006.1 hypothetical protein [Nitrospirota bacterium]HEW81180.1 hypothetical protein [Nitrospirota bacterium]